MKLTKLERAWVLYDVGNSAFTLLGLTSLWMAFLVIFMIAKNFAKIIPPEKSGEYFGLFDICGKGASFIGTMLVSLASQLTGSINLGVGSLVVLFILGLVLFGVSCRRTSVTE